MNRLAPALRERAGSRQRQPLPPPQRSTGKLVVDLISDSATIEFTS